MTTATLTECAMAPPAGPLDRLEDRLFSGGIRAFHEALQRADWNREAPSFVFVRDFMGLPERAPFDIDAMAAVSDLEAVRSLFVSSAETCGLLCVPRTVPAGLHILLLDPVVQQECRTWAYYEIASEKRISPLFTLRAQDIRIRSHRGLPVPDAQWSFLIAFSQALRKGDLRKSGWALTVSFSESSDVAELCAQSLGVTIGEIGAVLDEPAGLPVMAQRLGIATKQKAKPAAPLSRRTSLMRAVLRRFYVVPSRSMCTVTIHGPDGVGKSTACQLISQMFAGYPVGFASAHHVTSWKKRLMVADEATRAAGKQVSLLHRGLRVLYRASPQVLRDIWVTSSGYHRYSTKVNAEVLAAHEANRILLLDRYIYDLVVKNRTRQPVSRIEILLGWLHCFIMRRPRLAIVIEDLPSEVIKRKQELTEAEIGTYQTLMRRLLTGIGARFEPVAVKGRHPAIVARHVAQVIVRALGDDLHRLMRHEVVRAATVSDRK